MKPVTQRALPENSRYFRAPRTGNKTFGAGLRVIELLVESVSRRQ
jgi:hypothetical protein